MCAHDQIQISIHIHTYMLTWTHTYTRACSHLWLGGVTQKWQRTWHTGILSTSIHPYIIHMHIAFHGRNNSDLSTLSTCMTQRLHADIHTYMQTYIHTYIHTHSFRREDYVINEHADCIYDTILALSVTKWVHFNNGDDGIKKFFHKVYDSLREGGVFILEWQGWVCVCVHVCTCIHVCQPAWRGRFYSGVAGVCVCVHACMYESLREGCMCILE